MEVYPHFKAWLHMSKALKHIFSFATAKQWGASACASCDGVRGEAPACFKKVKHPIENASIVTIMKLQERSRRCMLLFCGKL